MWGGTRQRRKGRPASRESARLWIPRRPSGGASVALVRPPLVLRLPSRMTVPPLGSAPAAAAPTPRSPQAEGSGRVTVAALWRTARRLHRESGRALLGLSALTWGLAALVGVASDLWLTEAQAVTKLALVLGVTMPLTIAGVVVLPWRVVRPLTPEEAAWALVRTIPVLLPTFLVTGAVLGLVLESLLTLVSDWIIGPLALRTTWPSWVIALPTLIVGTVWFLAWSRWVFFPLGVAAGRMGVADEGLLTALRQTTARRRKLLPPLVRGMVLPALVVLWGGSFVLDVVRDLLPGAQAGLIEQGVVVLWRVVPPIVLGPWVAIFLRLLADAPPPAPARPLQR